MKVILSFIVSISIIITTACTTMTQTPIPVEASPASTSTPEVVPVSPTSTATVDVPTATAPPADFFSQNDITLPAPSCSAPTAAQTAGPYYTPNTPEKNDLTEEGMPGTRVLVVGYVLNTNCQPLSNAWIDFWQADANGVYDNNGYTLRGHQFTDEQGRYYLQTVIPGEYPGRTPHIHVKVKPEGGLELTSQLYFPDSPANASDGIFDSSLIVQMEERPDHLIAYFNFIVQ